MPPAPKDFGPHFDFPASGYGPLNGLPGSRTLSELSLASLSMAPANRQMGLALGGLATIQWGALCVELG